MHVVCLKIFNVRQDGRWYLKIQYVDAVCRHCYLENEGLLHLLARCTAFYNIHAKTVISLRDSIVNIDIWKKKLKVCKNQELKQSEPKSSPQN